MNLSPYVGLPWSDGGRTRDGYDCWGLIRFVYHELLGVDLPAYSGEYSTAMDKEAVASLIAEDKSRWTIIAPGKERLLDGILLLQGGIPSHIGVVVTNGRMLHMMPGMGSVIESYKTGRWANSIEGFYRWVR